MITHKIFHIRVGAEQCWEEIEGFVSGNKEMMSLVSVKLFNRYTGFLSNIDIVKKKGYEYILNFDNPKEERFNFVEMENEIKKMQKTFFIKRNPNHPLSRIAEKLGASIYGGFQDEKNFYIVLPSYKDFVVGDYGYKHGLGKGIFCFGEYRWENSDLDGYVENNEEDKPAFYGFHWLRSRGGDLSRLPSPQYNDFKVEGNIFKDYAETGKIKDDLTIFTI